MFKIKPATKNTVSEILSDFEQKVQQLRDLSTRKAQEVQDTEIQITSLEVVRDSAKAEAKKANATADKIAKFLTE